MKAKILVRTDRRGPDPGKILEGRHVSMNSIILRDFQCTEAGPYLGLIFPSYAYEIIPEVPDPTIKTLQENVRIRDISIGKMQEQIDRLQDNVVQLDREKRELEEKLAAADELVRFEEKKVVLPAAAAAAIDYYESYGTFSNTGILNCIVYENSRIARSARGALEQRVGEEAGDIIMRALVNGYTVEEPPTAEERMRTKVDALLDEHDIISPIPRERLVELLTLAARDAVAESQQAETQ